MSFRSVLIFIGKIISESIRFILFFASLFLLIVSIVFIAVAFQNDNLETESLLNLDDSSFPIFWIKSFAIYLLGVSVLGIYGFFYKNKPSIDWFTILAIINVILGIAVLSLISIQQVTDHDSEVVKKLEDSLGKYDWFNKQNSSAEIKNATKIWDTIQNKLECCGINSPEDWIPFRPPRRSNTYPISCCQDLKATVDNENICKDEMAIWQYGCAGKFRQSVILTFWSLVAFICINFIMSILGIVVICCQPKADFDI